MKVQIISVEPSDDLASLRDRVLRAQATLIVLDGALPSPAIQRRLDLVLIHRWAASVGSSLVVASGAGRLQQLAQENGIPCFSSPERALWASPGSFPGHPAGRPFVSPPSISPGKGEQHLPFPGAPPRSSLRTDAGTLRQALLGLRKRRTLEVGPFRAVVFTLGTGLFALAVLLGIPEATARLRLPTSPVSASAFLPKSTGTTLSALVQVSGRRLSTGQEVADTQTAAGSVLLQSKSSETLLVPPGLEIQASSPAVLFVTVSAATLSPQQMTWVDVRATQAGPQGNLPANSLSAVVGPLGLILEVTSSTGMRGGESELRAVVTASDLHALRAQLESELRTQALLRLRAQAPRGSILVPGSLSLGSPLQSVADADAGAAVDSVGMTLSAEATVLSFRASDLRTIAAQTLLRHTPLDETLDLDQMAMSMSGTPSGDAILHLRASAHASLDPDALAYALRLRPVQDAGRVLQGLAPPGTMSQIQIWPNWLPILPLYPWRIHVETNAT